MSGKPGRPCGSHSSSGKSNKFSVGQDVLVRWNDGLFYLGNIVKVDDRSEKCLVNFEDNSEYWALYKDIQRGAIQGEIICCICQGESSDAPNEIVLCDNCGLGYHQQCHNPPLDKEVLQPDVKFMCRLCVFATTVKRGGALKKGPNAKAFQAMKQSLPYNLHKLTWDAQHKTNSEQCYCYCGGPGDWYVKMLQCCRCRQWFHEACIQCLETPLLYGDRFYMFVCSHCNSGPEYIKRIDLKWVDLVQLALFNLTVQYAKKYYDVIETVLPWIFDKWENLQAHKFESPSREEIAQKVLETLQNHKSRFSWGREIKKKTTLWGLRVRIPPPAPTVILPTDGQITDEVMGSLQMKGRKTKTFVPMQCNSPVPLKYWKRKGMDIDDSIVFKSKKAKRLLLQATKSAKNGHSANQEYVGYNGAFSFGKRTNGHTVDFDSDIETSSQCTLDSIIPPLSNFDGYNHPFKTVLERNDELAKRNSLKARLLDLYRNGSDCDTVSQCSVDSGNGNECDMNGDDSEEAPFPEQNTRTRGRRKRQRTPDLTTCKRSRMKTKGLLDDSVPNVVDPAMINAVKSQEVNFQQLKSSVKNYFGAADRLAQGEKFHVLARRVTPKGKVQYLVEWGGLVA